MSRPDFDCIKDYDQFPKYSWSRAELSNICKKHGLLFVGSEKKLNKVIAVYFNGEIIPPRRNWLGAGPLCYQKLHSCMRR